MSKETISVWTRQNKEIIRELQEKGRYIAERDWIEADMEDTAPVMFVTYDWLAKHSPKAHLRPADVEYLIWVSYAKETALRPDANTVLLELAIDPEIITPVNINKWGTILNYSYIPKDEEDAKRHLRLLQTYGVSDAKAFMSQFYPQIKKEILNSWPRLFDPHILMDSESEYGAIWEVKKEWVTDIIY